ncbi:uncharacterized protein MYCGRDRAFT_97981 [Zymoseptoria tritici IPO323]|uniref:Uncharacterized protein n=1 Tax=Zymoseptoria tritici (strain CBS 115943 / IPO323) TaxID=336722 RepID=F9XRZ0_ZYMTI|nr:uncharacterized protein MYCGRDRAFT_97981 [Zymoseptoria tritici IPO323]EGP82003.1 hypothetical protein MYCGRDRAFT_97981 [Zymoseptoria tritici IPO323]
MHRNEMGVLWLAALFQAFRRHQSFGQLTMGRGDAFSSTSTIEDHQHSTPGSGDTEEASSHRLSHETPHTTLQPVSDPPWLQQESDEKLRGRNSERKPKSASTLRREAQFDLLTPAASSFNRATDS